MSSLDDPQWATNANFSAGPSYTIGRPNKARPPSGNIGEGFNGGAGLPAEWLNYLHYLHGLWLASLRDGTVSVKSVIADGTGGVVGTSTAGTVGVASAISGASLPTPTTVANTLYNELVPVGWALVINSGGSYSVSRGVNISAVTKVGTGVVKLTVGTAAPNKLLGSATLCIPTLALSIFCDHGSSDASHVYIDIVNGSNTATDSSFFVVIYGY